MGNHNPLTGKAEPLLVLWRKRLERLIQSPGPDAEGLVGERIWDSLGQIVHDLETNGTIALNLPSGLREVRDANRDYHTSAADYCGWWLVFVDWLSRQPTGVLIESDPGGALFYFAEAYQQAEKPNYHEQPLSEHYFLLRQFTTEVHQASLEAIQYIELQLRTQAEKPKGPTRRGARKQYDSDKDSQWASAWKSRRHQTRAECAKALGTTKQELVKALDRHRKRST